MNTYNALPFRIFQISKTYFLAYVSWLKKKQKTFFD